MNVSELARVVQPLFDSLPIDRAMAQLVVTEGALAKQVDLVESICREAAIAPALAAGLWLYIDELDRSHAISQSLSNTTGAFWHGIMHRREGDFANAHYWFRHTGLHPAMDTLAEYDGHAFIEEVAIRHQGNPPDLVARQRAEWTGLFSWCGAHAES